MPYYSKKPKPTPQLTTKLRDLLGYEAECMACQMELHPYKDENGDIQIPRDFCDARCRETYTIMKRMLLRGRVEAEIRYMKTYYPRSQDLPMLDLRL